MSPMKLVVTPVTPFAQNCSCIICEATGKAALVDPGGDIERLEAVLTSQRGELDCILITHAHLDHAGAAQPLAQRHDVPIIGPHRDDAFLAGAMQQQAQMFGGSWPVQDFSPDRWLEHGDEVTVGELRFEVRHCPGHTPGHVVFYCAEEKIVFVGDVLFKGSIGRSDFPRGDHAALLRSINEQLLTLPDDVVIVPGHGPTSTIGDERRSNPFLVS
jgi:glyoxylase-like metal-dependent hydrolase (beta-lactamase superfamily II)